MGSFCPTSKVSILLSNGLRMAKKLCILMMIYSGSTCEMLLYL
jgi:hypothetical protein